MNSLKDLPVVYIDETGIDRYLYRSHARAPRGEKVYEKINGRRFERTSIVAGQVDGEFIAPMIYKESMTSDFFVKWFKTPLLPALKTPHVIVMDNASFHPKNILDELCVQDKHFFLPLPPYSPDLNPIEQAWAILKKKVTDLLREVPNVFECLECFLKLNDYKMRHRICRMLFDINTLLFKILSLVSIYSPKKNGGANFFSSSKHFWAASASSQMTRQTSSPQRVAIASGKLKASMIDPKD